MNDELQEIQSLLKSAGSLLKPGGRLVLISFHSLEDRLVKDALRDGAKAGQFELLTKKPVVATEQESLRNPRSRSAKLRAAEQSLRSGRGCPAVLSGERQPATKSPFLYRNPGPGNSCDARGQQDSEELL